MYGFEASSATDITYTANFRPFYANSDAFGPDLWLAQG
jgi:hypothetical protein